MEAGSRALLGSGHLERGGGGGSGPGGAERGRRKGGGVGTTGRKGLVSLLSFYINSGQN